MSVFYVSEAAAHDSQASVKIQDVSEGQDCHKNKIKAEQTSNDTSNKCCDGDICKCKAGFCSGGLSKFFGNDGFDLAYLASENTKFSFAQQSIIFWCYRTYTTPSQSIILFLFELSKHSVAAWALF